MQAILNQLSELRMTDPCRYSLFRLVIINLLAFIEANICRCYQHFNNINCLLDSSHQEQQTPFLSTSTLSQIFLNVLCTNCVSILYSIQVYKNVLSFHKPHILKYLPMIPRSAPHPQTPQVAFFVLTLIWNQRYNQSSNVRCYRRPCFQIRFGMTSLHKKNHFPNWPTT